MKLEERFWNKVDRCDHGWACRGCCWAWTGGTMRRGYGCIRVDGKTRQAHRVSYELARGPLLPIPNLFICHRCDNVACVNPSHLWVGTPYDNMADRRDKGRDVRGERHGRAVLKAHDVEAIRASYARGEKQCRLAKTYIVSHTTIRRIVMGQRWGHLPTL